MRTMLLRAMAIFLNPATELNSFMSYQICVISLITKGWLNWDN